MAEKFDINHSIDEQGDSSPRRDDEHREGKEFTVGESAGEYIADHHIMTTRASITPEWEEFFRELDKVRSAFQAKVEKMMSEQKTPRMTHQQLSDLIASAGLPDDADEFIKDALSIWGDNQAT